MIEMIVAAFAAGVLTVLAPCILPLIPVIMGGSLSGPAKVEPNVSLKRPLVIIASLAVSITLFTLLLKSTTLLLGVPIQVWSVIAGSIILVFGVTTLFPVFWEKLMIATGMQAASSRLLARSQTGKTPLKDVLLGAALGPVFNSCSPTYALIVALVLPVSFFNGFIYLIAYVVGLSAVLLLLAIFGSSLVRKMKWMSKPGGVFQKIIGCIFIVIGIAIIFGIDKKVQTFVLEKGWYDSIIQLERSLH